MFKNIRLKKIEKVKNSEYIITVEWKPNWAGKLLLKKTETKKYIGQVTTWQDLQTGLPASDELCTWFYGLWSMAVDEEELVRL